MKSTLQLLGVALFSLLLAAASPARAQGLTFTTNTPSVGSTPVSVAVADVNGDGYPDLISANYGPSTLTVLTNNGSGVFVSSATVTLTARPFFITAADINGDGKPDLICANYSANSLIVLTNNGKGVFGSNATLTAGLSAPYALAVADIYGNGKPALICANNASGAGGAGYLTFFTNTGPGGFALNNDIGVGGGVEYVLAADVNGDGQPDLITANNSDSTLSVLINNGSGGFSATSTPTVGTAGAGPLWVVAVDINRNGKPALVSANGGSSTLTVLTNGGFGHFGSNAIINLPSSPTSLVTADFNGDGLPDLAVAEANNSVEVFTNNGGGGFGSNTVVNFAVQQKSLITADVTGNNKPGLITANDNALGTLTVLTQSGTGRPCLKIAQPAVNSMVVSWVASSNPFILQTNNNLATTNWSPANLPVTTGHWTNQSTLTPPRGNLFFRLKH